MSVNKPRYESTRILSVFVNTKAVAFVIMESALDVIHMQRIPFESVHNEKLLQKVKDVITFSSPITVVLEDPHSKYSRKSKRIKNLIKRFSEYSQEV